MPMKILREDGEHFVLHGNNGEFRVHHSKLSPAQVARMRKSVQALADGGAVNDETPAEIPPQHFPNPDALANPVDVPPPPPDMIVEPSTGAITTPATDAERKALVESA